MYVPPDVLNLFSTAVWKPPGHRFFTDFPKRFFLLILPLLLTVVSFARFMSLAAFLGSVIKTSPILRRWFTSSFMARRLLVAFMRQSSACFALDNTFVYVYHHAVSILQHKKTLRLQYPQVLFHGNLFSPYSF